MPSHVHQEPARFTPLLLWISALKWYLLPEVPFMWVMPLAFFFGVVFPLVRWGLSRPNNRLTHVPIAGNSDCSAGVPLRADREVSGDSTQVPTSPVVLTNQPWVAPVVPCKAQACEYPGMLFSTRPVAQVSHHGNMSALEGDAVINNSSSAVDLFKPSKQVTSTRSPPKLLQGMAMHKAMQKVYAMPAPKSTTTASASTSSVLTSSALTALASSSSSASTALASSSLASSSQPASASLASSSSTSSSSSAPTSSASSSSDIDELCEALDKLDIYEPDTDVPDAVPGTPEVQQVVENEDTDSSQQAQVAQDVQETFMALPPPPPPPLPLPLPLPPPPPPPILYTQELPQQTAIIHPDVFPEVVVAAVAAAASASPASAIPVATSTGTNNNRPRLQIRRPIIRPRSRLRLQRISASPMPARPRPPPAPSISPPPHPPTPPATTSSAMSREDQPRRIACPRRRLQRPDIPSASIPSSSALPSSEAEPAPPTQILREYAEQSDSFMGGDDIFAEIMGDDFDPFDVAAFD